MPEERGSIYKSTANEIGEALKAKLGGEGFAPKDWSDNLNLLGIASEDTEAAINSLKESEGSGERGSILLSTANAIGSMLNKKYNSQRGFSPAEWASATRKMKALETDTKSGGIVNLKGAKEVPITSLAGTINPTLEGTDTLIATRNGKNLWEFGDKTVDTVAYIMLYFTKPLPAGTYTISCDLISTTTNCSFRFRKEDGSYLEQTTFTANVGRVSKTLTISEPAYRVYIYSSTQGSGETTTWKDVQIEVGSEATAYTPYVAPTTYTANLGRTVYGGSADIVKGEGMSKYVKLSLAVADMNNSETYPGWRNSGVRAIIGANVSSSVTDGVSTVGPYWNYNTNGNNDIIFLPPTRYNMSQTEWKETYPDLVIDFLIEMPEEETFTFDPIEVLTSGEVENFYTSNGDTAITYYEEPTAYTRGSASGGIASFSGANTEFPFTKLKATIAPSVEGVSRVVAKNEGKNLLDFNAFSDYSNWETDITENQSYPTSSANRGLLIDLPQGTYTVTFGIDAETYPTYLYLCKDDGSASTRLIYFTGASFSVSSGSFTVDGSSKYYLRMGSTGTEESFNGQVEKISFAQIEVGSSATEYTAYKQPTTYTAELGETVFGGSVDLVSGEVIDSNDNTFYIDPQEIYPREGVNNIWNDANGDTEVTYFEEE